MKQKDIEYVQTLQAIGSNSGQTVKDILDFKKKNHPVFRKTLLATGIVMDIDGVLHYTGVIINDELTARFCKMLKDSNIEGKKKTDLNKAAKALAKENAVPEPEPVAVVEVVSVVPETLMEVLPEATDMISDTKEIALEQLKADVAYLAIELALKELKNSVNLLQEKLDQILRDQNTLCAMI